MLQMASLVSSRFASAPAAFPWPLLAQYCAVGVDPYTVRFGHFISDQFKLSVQGERNVSHALTNLPVYGAGKSDDNCLSFGFGIGHIIRNPELNTDGFVLAALVGALLEYYDEEFTARVCNELAKLLTEDEEKSLDRTMIPPLRQWKAMVRVCNGLLATTRLGVVIEDFAHMNSTDSSRTPKAVYASPQSVAKALRGLGALSLGGEKAITIVGGGDAGLIAALAEWLFSFKVVVLTQSGKRLYTNCENLEPQVLICFDYHLGDKDSSEPPPQVRGPLYNLNDSDTLSAGIPGSTPISAPSGRVQWHFLATVFSKDFLKLVNDEPKTLGLAIGTAARGFEGLVTGELGVNYPSLASVHNMQSLGSYGAGLVETITNWMPGLRRISGHMNRGVKMSFSESGDCYREQLTKLRKICGPCEICSLDDNRADVAPIVEGRPFCKLVLVEMIIALGLALSKMIVTSELLPRRSGIEGFYNRQVEKRIQTKDPALSAQEHFIIVYGNELHPLNVTRLEVAVEIFSGSRADHDIRDGLVAISNQGICAYLVALEGAPSRRSAAEESLIRIVPGKIGHQKKVFDRVSDGRDLSESESGHLWEESWCQNPPQLLYCS